MEITFQNMGNNLHNFNTYFGEKQWRKLSLALLRWQMKLSEAPIFFWCGRRRRTFWRTNGRPAQNCGSLAIPPRHRRKLTRTTCITCTSGLSCQCKTNAMYSKMFFNFMCFSVMFIIGIIADEELEVIFDAADIVEDIIIYDEPLPKLPK